MTDSDNPEPHEDEPADFFRDFSRQKPLPEGEALKILILPKEHLPKEHLPKEHLPADHLLMIIF